MRIHNTNTGKLIHASVPVVDGEAAASGDFAIDGVSGTAAQIRLDFIEPAGSRTGKLLPMGKPTSDLKGIEVTLIDVANPCVFVRASTVGVPPDLTPQQIEDHPTLPATLDTIRRQAGVIMGLADTPEDVPGSVPKVAIISPLAAGGNNLVVRAMSVGQPHRAIPVTVALAVAAAARLPSTVVAQCLSEPVSVEGVVIHHASGCRLMLNTARLGI